MFGSALAQDRAIQRGKIVKLDVEAKTITLRVGDQVRDFGLLDSMQVLDAKGKNLAEKLQGFKAGAEVNFKAAKKDGKDVLVGIRLLPEAGAAGKPVSGDTSKLAPLDELGIKEYQGFAGGWYPESKNERPRDHEAAGLRLAREVVPRDADGRPSPEGKIVLLSIGMSNTSQASQGFSRQLQNAEGLHPRFVFVDGAQGGMTAARIQDPDNADGTKYWSTVDQRLRQAGVTRAQVQAVWIKQADAGPSQGFPAYAKKLQSELAKIVRILPERFPNVKLAYLSGRTYGGYATTKLNPEPYAYESQFSVKWLIEQQLTGDMSLNYDPARGKVAAPWLSWGPNLWANGTKKNSAGVFYEVSDFGKDGTHHSPAGVEKLGRHILEFFRRDSTARNWFLERP
jgi:Cu/Ag efflux protein CusF